MQNVLVSQGQPDVYGHRGCRGIMPENTIEAFKKALEFSIKGIEWDVVVNKDKQLVISHEEYMDKNYCLTPDGASIKEEKKHNIYRMTQEEIRLYDCGTKYYSKFPEQEHFRTYKPLVKEAFKELDLEHRTILFEIKSDPKYYNLYQPEPAEYVDIILKEVKDFKYKNNIIFMCFDPFLLNELHKKAPKYRLVFLSEYVGKSVETLLKYINFKPYALGIHNKLITAKTIQKAHKRHIKIFAWTVNKEREFNRLSKLGIDAIITDYPNRFALKKQ